MSKNALISVFNKDGVEEFARALKKLDWQLYASGGTAKKLREAKIPVSDVAKLVGGGAILGHRVVTLSREIYAGLLATESKADERELERLGIPRIDLVYVDLYPLQQAVAEGRSEAEVIELTDIGGPTLLRAAAKGRRITICDRHQAERVLEWMEAGEPNSEAFRRELAANAEAIVARYALNSARFTSGGFWDGEVDWQVAVAKYGENPWQKRAYLYGHNAADPLGIIHFKLEQGTEPSYNNYADMDRLLQTITHIAAGFDNNYKHVPAIALGAKHGNVCGAAVSDNPKQTIKRMLLGDSRAIFGGVVMFNFELTEELAETLLTFGLTKGRRLLDGVIAPKVSAGARELLARKGDKCRLLTNSKLGRLRKGSLDKSLRTRYVRGGRLIQDNYTFVLNLKDKKMQKSRKLSKSAERDLVLGWAIGSTSNSNTVTIIKNQQLIGNGVGQQDRVSACELALKRAKDAGHNAKGAVAYSDSFFPFPDGPTVLAKAGVRAILASSGSVNDAVVVKAAKQAGAVMYLIPDAVGRGFYAH